LVYVDYAAAKDAKSKLAVLDKWSKQFPDSQLAKERDEMYLPLYEETKDYRKLVDKSVELLNKVPTHYLATIHVIQKVPMLPQPTAKDLELAEKLGREAMDNTDKIRPAQLDDAGWAKAKPDVIGIGRQAVIFSLTKKNDLKGLEAEYRKVLQADPTQAAYSFLLGQAIYNQATAAKDVSRYPEVMFHWARALESTGLNSLQPAQKTQISTSLEQLYKAYHGDLSDLDKVKTVAKANVFPPADFKIVDKNTIAKEKFANAQAYDAAHPIEAWWRDEMRGVLTGPDSAKNWESFNGVLLPQAPPMPFTHFKGRIVSMTPENNPTEIVLSVEKEGMDAPADAKLVWKEPALKGNMKVGEEISFKGTVKSFQKEPFMVTFDMDETDGPEVLGWTGTGPEPEKGKSKAKAKAPAPKGKAGKSKAK
jgi:hypothetical protein